jgi:hypothetical protein
MQWNQLEMARDEIFTGTEQFRASELCELLEIALVNNKPEFVKLCKRFPNLIIFSIREN